MSGKGEDCWMRDLLIGIGFKVEEVLPGRKFYCGNFSISTLGFLKRIFPMS